MGRWEHRLRVFENRMLRGIFGTKRDEITGEWRKLQNEQLHGLYFLPTIVRVIKSRQMRWGGKCCSDWERERYVQGFGGEI
jgi:hypothetical protein